ncbi:MAG: hypothetical protein RIQ59_1337 [Bacteroidota bacterium]|jgi:hypothetical protein
MEFEKAKQILNAQNAKQYTDEEIIQMVELLTILASVSINNLLNNKNDE